MARRTFVYTRSGVQETTPEESRALCDEVAADAASRREPLKTGLPRSRRDWRNAAGVWPVHSDSMACSSAEQVKEEQEFLRSRGVNVEYDDEFRPIWTSRLHKKAYQEALEYYDNDAGYSDAAPKHFHSDIKRFDITNPTTRAEAMREAKEKLQRSELRLFGHVLTK